MPSSNYFDGFVEQEESLFVSDDEDDRYRPAQLQEWIGSREIGPNRGTAPNREEEKESSREETPAPQARPTVMEPHATHISDGEVFIRRDQVAGFMYPSGTLVANTDARAMLHHVRGGPEFIHNHGNQQQHHGAQSTDRQTLPHSSAPTPTPTPSQVILQMNEQASPLTAAQSSPQAPSQTFPQAPSQTLPQAPSQTLLQAPSQTLLQAPSQTLPQATAPASTRARAARPRRNLWRPEEDFFAIMAAKSFSQPTGPRNIKPLYDSVILAYLPNRTPHAIYQAAFENYRSEGRLEQTENGLWMIERAKNGSIYGFQKVLTFARKWAAALERQALRVSWMSVEQIVKARLKHVTPDDRAWAGVVGRTMTGGDGIVLVEEEEEEEENGGPPGVEGLDFGEMEEE
ncbi:hypothetical protein MBLNU230_g7779t1 [Neophaeotheca triangularis]